MRLLVAALLILCAWQTRSAVQVWRADATLWAHAVAHAPSKPRPVLNLAKAQLLEGRFRDAEQGFHRAAALAAQAHLPSYDRADAVAAAQANLRAVLIVQAVFAERR